MYRSALRSTPRATSALRQASLKTAAPRRFASTTPSGKKSSWKSFAVRCGIVGGAVYWYNTSPFFAEEAQPLHVTPPPQFSDEDLPTVEAVVEQKRREAEARLAKAKAEAEAEAAKAEATTPAKPTADATAALPSARDAESGETPSAPVSGGPEALEAEAEQQGAFNPETGEINWDCPCLGGMADGPCGEEFKAAFSCFVFSKEEPKGMDCIDKFQFMQDCFRKHPEIYGDELADDEEAAESPADGAAEAATPATKTSSTLTGEASEKAAAGSSTITPLGDAKPAADELPPADTATQEKPSPTSANQ
ncbi:hypothetical protein BX600DRAFT_29876 [Xylariales sp. PMI_506]|nr:hypothetical protein BX600DRAFT_29876 [Xylariales sp. PMI_506]